MPPEQKATVIVFLLLGLFIFSAQIQSAAVASYGFFGFVKLSPCLRQSADEITLSRPPLST